MITCWDLRNVEGKVSCCSSCHDDADEYGDSMCGDEENWSVCCAVDTWLEKLGLDTLEKAPNDHPIVVAANEQKRIDNE